MFKLPVLTVSFTCLFICHLVYGQEAGQEDSQKDGEADQWSGCWSLLKKNICKAEKGPEWTSVLRVPCGFLSLGSMELCRRSFAGCEATPCLSVFYTNDSLCTRVFQGRLPIMKNGFDDCLLGFHRARCCPE